MSAPARISSSLTFKNKIALLAGVAIGGIVLLTAGAAWTLRAEIIDGRKAGLVMAVQSQRSVAAAYQAKAEKGEMTVEAAQKAAIDALRLARFGGADGKANYFFIWNTDGVGVMHPFKPEWNGQNMVGKIIDPNGIDIIAALVKGANTSADGNAFVPMNFPRPGKTEPVPKLQYVSSVPQWHWIIGSGLYMDDVDAEVFAALIKGLAVASVLLLAIGAIGIAIY
ncbi:MAG: cache domain-containing protein, partial [Pseudomonadota bacterium]|nr:cache domain-containing protein [Pseudomonadota bacterium]